jgi:hypothetical protein
MAGTVGNIVATSVISPTVTKVVLYMSSEMFKKEKLYQSTMSIVRNMLNNGFITAEEYTLIDAIMLEKYKPVLGTLFSGITLT